MLVITFDFELIRKPQFERINRAKSGQGSPHRSTEHWHKQVDRWQAKSFKNTKPGTNDNMNNSAFLEWLQGHDAIDEPQRIQTTITKQSPISNIFPLMVQAQDPIANSKACSRLSADGASLYEMTEAEQQQRKPTVIYQKFKMGFEIGNLSPHPFYDLNLSQLLMNQSAIYSTMARHDVLPTMHNHGCERRKLTFRKPESNQSSLLQDLYAKSLEMDLIWKGYRRQPNKGNMAIFRLLRPNIEKLAQRMYGENSVNSVLYGKHKDTSYILVCLGKEPAGAEGYASDEFMTLSSNFFEVLKDGQAAEAEIIAGTLKPELVRRYGISGLSLVDLFEIQVNHPISGRLLVGPIEKQRKFMGL